MKLMQINDDKFADILNDFLRESSKDEFKGIRNAIITAYMNDGTPITCIMDATDTITLSGMLFHVQSHLFARELFQNYHYYRELHQFEEEESLESDDDYAEDME